MMLKCEICGEELYGRDCIPKRYEDKNGKRHIYLCYDCQCKNNKVIECCNCYAYTNKNTKLIWQGEPICPSCAKDLVLEFEQEYKQKLSNVRKLKKLLPKEDSI